MRGLTERNGNDGQAHARPCQIQGAQPRRCREDKGSAGRHRARDIHALLEVAFGDLYQRTNLDPKIRQTVSLVALAAANQHDLLRIHIDIARKLGFTKEELSEVFQQMAPFTGFPGPMLGIRALKEAFEEKP